MPLRHVIFGIAGNKKKPLAKKTALKAIKLLEKNKICFAVDSGFLKTKKAMPLKRIRADFFLVFGGDGTMLHVAREIKKQVPLIGINCGTHGHLMGTNPEEAGIAIEKILSGQFSLEERARLAVVIDGKSAPGVLNEIIIAPKKSFTMTNFSVGVGENFSECWADAITVATPTGSTAFALSAGGKRIENSENVFEVLPVHVFSGTKEAFFVQDNNSISVAPLEKGVACEAITDGQSRIKVKKNVLIKKSAEPALFIKLL